MDGVTIVDHPLVQHKLTLLRDKTRSTKVFRELFQQKIRRAAVLRGDPRSAIGQRRSRNACWRRCSSPKLAGKKLVFGPCWTRRQRLSRGHAEPAGRHARVAHIGIYRDPRTLTSVEYFFKAPDDMPERLALVLHPMLATGNSGRFAAVDRLRKPDRRLSAIQRGLLATRQAIEKVRANHPDVHIWTAAIDDAINEAGYILPRSRRCWRSDVWDALAVDISIDVVTLKQASSTATCQSLECPWGLVRLPVGEQAVHV